MELWYLAGKLEATGSIELAPSPETNAADRLSHHCKSVNIGELEYVTKLMV